MHPQFGPRDGALPRYFVILFALLAVVAAAVYLRFVDLGGPSLWTDEILHLERATKALEEPWHAWLLGLKSDAENGSIFYGSQLLARSVAEGETAARLVPALLGCLTVPLMAALGFAVRDTITGLVAAALLAVSPLHVFYSREGRVYAAVMLVSTILLILLARSRSRHVVPLAYVTCVGAAYLGAATAPTILAFALIAISRSVLEKLRPDRNPAVSRESRRVFGHFVLAATIGLVLIVSLYLVRPDRLDAEAMRGFESSTTRPLSVGALDRMLASLTISGLDGSEANHWSGVFLLLACLGSISIWRRKPRAGFLISGMMVLTIGLSFAALIQGGRWYNVRYTAAGLPAFLLLVALGVRAVCAKVESWSAWSRNTTLASTAGLLTAALLTTCLVMVNFDNARNEPYQRPDWRGVANLIADLAVDDEPVLAGSSSSTRNLRYYLDRSSRPLPVTDVRSSIEEATRLARTNGTAWLLTAGYEVRPEYRAWARSFHPVAHRRISEIGLYFYPDLPRFLETRFAAGKGAQLVRSMETRSGELDIGSEELLLGRGWSFPEVSSDGTTFRWATELTAELALPSATNANAALRIRLLPYPGRGKPPQSLSLELNSLWLGEWKLEPGWQEIAAPVPHGYWQESTNLLLFKFGWLASPTDLDPSSRDRRSLAAAFDYLKLVELPLAQAEDG